MPEPKRPLKVFLCHAHADRDPVHALYDRLTKDGVDAWLDKEKLLPGQDWELEIRKAVREVDVVVVCLSKQFNQAGFRQKEVRWALDTAMEQPEGEIFIIPLRLEACETLESLRHLHWLDLFESDGYVKLTRALNARLKSVDVEAVGLSKDISEISPGFSSLPIELQTFLTEQFYAAQQKAAKELAELSKNNKVLSEDINIIKNVVKDDISNFTQAMVSNLLKTIPKYLNEQKIADRMFFSISQINDVPVTSANRENIDIRYAYHRSADACENNIKGEDFLAFLCDSDRIVFVVCDGIGQSFHGDLSELVGSTIVDWLWNFGTDKEVKHFQKNLENFMNSLTVEVTKVIENYPHPKGIPEILRTTLEEQKRYGSETTIVVGDINLAVQKANFAWLGDTRLKLWNGSSQISLPYGNFGLSERWSSRRGVIGDIHFAQYRTDVFTAVVSYTDGISILDSKPVPQLTDDSIESLFEKASSLPESDDMTMLEISFGSNLHS